MSYPDVHVRVQSWAGCGCGLFYSVRQTCSSRCVWATTKPANCRLDRADAVLGHGKQDARERLPACVVDVQPELLRSGVCRYSVKQLLPLHQSPTARGVGPGKWMGSVRVALQ
jgi:hypothetical protein